MTTMNLFDMTDTWNASGTTFDAIKMNVTDTASASGSLLMDLQVGGTSQFSVRKDGKLTLPMGTLADPILSFTDAGQTGFFSPVNGAIAYGGTSRGEQFRWSPNGIFRIGYSGELGFCSAQTSSVADLIVTRDAADTLALRRDTNPQTFRVYNTYSGGGANYERGIFRWISNFLEIGTEAAGTGSARAILLSTGGATRWNIGTAGHLTAGADNTYDIGANGANRPRNLFVAGSVTFGTGAFLQSASRFVITGPADGVITISNAATGDFNRLQFGGTTSSFPSLKRNGTALETKLADDSAYAPHAAQYFEVTDGITAPGSAAGRARIYVDTADGDLKVIFADGTIKTIVTDT